MEQDEVFKQRIFIAHQQAERWLKNSLLVWGGVISFLFLTTLYQWYQLKKIISMTQNNNSHLLLNTQGDELKKAREKSELLQAKVTFIEKWRQQNSLYVVLQMISSLLPSDVCLIKLIPMEEKTFLLEGKAIHADSITHFSQLLRKQTTIKLVELKALHQSEKESSFELLMVGK